MTSIRRLGTSACSRSSIASRRARGSDEAVVMRRRGRYRIASALHRSRRHADILFARHSSTHPEGWRDWPYETPATSRKGTVPNPSGSNYKAWEMWQGGFHDLRPLTPAEVFSYAARVASLQGMPDGLSAGRSLRVRAVLRSPRGRLCGSRQRRPRRAAPPDPGGTPLAVALRGLPPRPDAPAG